MVRRLALLALLCVLCALSALAAQPLFPAPLHITRQIHDPISDKTSVLDEYGVGNRLISIAGTRTSIADYEKGELIEIDRDSATYSVTRFDAVAKAAAMGEGKEAHAQSKTTSTAPSLRSAGMKATRFGRNAEFFEADVDSDAVKERVEIAVDRATLVSKEALEVLLGSAYPGVRRAEHEAVFSAARSPRERGLITQSSDGSDAAFALPVEQVIHYEVDGQKLEFRNSVVRIGSETPPAEMVSIPAGARLVDSRYTAITKELELLQNPKP
jgi:hypothetical protein